jgi:hypothetical protein
MAASEDKKLEILHDHYRESFLYIYDREKQRDKLFLIIIALVGVVFLEVQYSVIFGSTIKTIKLIFFELDLSVMPIAIFLSVTWTYLFVIVLKYCQLSILIERQYDYLHKLEDRISNFFGDLIAYCREGRAYLDNYPLFSDLAWIFYVAIFPIIIILSIGLLIYREQNSVVVPYYHLLYDIFIACGIIIAFILYRISLIKKSLIFLIKLFNNMTIKQIIKYFFKIIFGIFLLLIVIVFLGAGIKMMADMAQNKPSDFVAINTFLTESLVIITGIYAYFTLLMVREMKKSRQKLDEPNIQISLEPQVRWGNFFDLIVENLGNVPAYDLKLSIEPSGLKTIGDKKLEDLNLFHKLIPVFGVRQKIKTFAIAYVDFINSDQPKKISLTAEYKTKDNDSRVQSYDFDMDVYLKMSCESEKSLTDVAKQIERLADAVSEFSKINKNIKQ